MSGNHWIDNKRERVIQYSKEIVYNNNNKDTFFLKIEK